MAKGYWIGRADVHNDEGYKPYAAANPAIFRKFGRSSWPNGADLKRSQCAHVAATGREAAKEVLHSIHRG